MHTTVLPFILRGVNLLGIESVNYPIAQRRRLWARLATDLKPAGLLESIAIEKGLDAVPEATAAILAGKVRGRVLINTVA